ncbi:hypothetical protein RND61_08270 [Streptomyces sp. TRM76323]|uniref:Uncharacterized protein n=1 Tax=Streptomyces tamarix TaxID=3078565 RepID=A0ABU3QH18_9ACTN|nr:hypothetical protein [Streptomyces tamarix]MDT9682068.1 hypothetical protein [Streptomyces tamarix]
MTARAGGAGPRDHRQSRVPEIGTYGEPVGRAGGFFETPRLQTDRA